MRQAALFSDRPQSPQNSVPPFKTQLLKWVGNKQRFAHEIISYFPPQYGTYFEPFLGSGAVLGTLAPKRSVASDACGPLARIWQLLHDDPERLVEAYRERWKRFRKDRARTYEQVKASFNESPTPEDLFFLSRSCYGGVIRFRRDGYMSTPIGIHNPVPPESVAHRIGLWRERTQGASFVHSDFEETIARARAGDLVYCDPPYSDTQAILYGSQDFTLERLFRSIEQAKNRGAFVALSIDGHKKSGKKQCGIATPPGLFESECVVNCGRSMLRRFQMSGQTLEAEVVSDRLLLTWC
ncbi:MAG TPA: Dam family site-specific DNA-(adenine-N6)-methyltransferase [Polyangiaceae bacterium]|nr:Dam family site-specific DNA-(adenine-N6)-methyltransferase [Polyangiaceae bacterium]